MLVRCDFEDMGISYDLEIASVEKPDQPPFYNSSIDLGKIYLKVFPFFSLLQHCGSIQKTIILLQVILLIFQKLLIV